MTRVLVVDDHEPNIYYLGALLRGHGYEVDQAHHGAEALALAHAAPPDLVVSDLLMPVMDGYTLLRRWKGDPRLRDVPFVVYTATYTQPEDEQLAIDLGADSFILKPAEPDDFLRCIREVLDRGASGVPTAVVQDEDEGGLLQTYSEALIRKLEDKTLQLQEANAALQADIVERTIVEAELAEKARLLDQTQDAIVVHDGDQRVRYWNRAAERNHGWTSEEAVGRLISELHCPDTAQLDLVMAELERSGEWSGELRLARRDGAQVVAEGRWTLLPAAEGAPRSILAVNTDVTERRKTEAQLLRAQRSESIGTLASGIAHDLNNLLAPIVTGAALLRMRDHDARTAEIIDAMEASARRGTALVRQVVSFTRGVEGARVRVRMADVVDELISIATTTFPPSIAVRSETPDGLWDVTGDPTQLDQVLLNLLVNARDALPDGGHIDVRAFNVESDSPMVVGGERLAAGRYVVLEVTDDGIGMAPSLQDRIFEPFLTTKEPGAGTGLGLSTVLGIVKSHGGIIDVTSRPGHGSRFEVYLPAHTDGGARPAEPATEVPRPTPSS